VASFEEKNKSQVLSEIRPNWAHIRPKPARFDLYFASFSLLLVLEKNQLIIVTKNSKSQSSLVAKDFASQHILESRSLSDTSSRALTLSTRLSQRVDDNDFGVKPLTFSFSIFHLLVELAKIV
jgi:hypothetical protein